MAMTTKNVSVSMKFGNGTTDSGGTKIMSVSIGQLNKDAFNESKAFNLAQTISRLYSQLLISVELTKTDYLTSD